MKTITPIDFIEQIERLLIKMRDNSHDADELLSCMSFIRIYLSTLESKIKELDNIII